jgi:alkylhydroperoxidase/carboxymuconolactone decarboxylase family protein YurZ
MTDRLEQAATEGRATRQRVQGEKSDALMGALDSIDPRLSAWSDSFVFGQVWADSHLDHEEQVLVAISALATGGHVAQLRSYLHGAQQAGIDPDKIQDALMMIVVYAGFPAALMALDEWRKVRDSHTEPTAESGKEH